MWFDKAQVLFRVNNSILSTLFDEAIIASRAVASNDAPAPFVIVILLDIHSEVN